MRFPTQRPQGLARALALVSLAALAAPATAQTFTPKAPGPGGLPTHTISGAVTPREDAVRFLNRATFGATPTDTTWVVANGNDAWLNQQFALPPTLNLPGMAAIGCAPDLPGFDATNCPTYDPVLAYEQRNRLWWQHALSAPDQLRQRVAFALSEILVISDVDSVLLIAGASVADYYDVLIRGAFGNFRDLLEEATLHPAMGHYLSMAKNRGEDLLLNTRPDENFAREIMQLFTIGLYELEQNGETRLDAAGDPIPTYNQEIVTQMARALTGWNFRSNLFSPSSDLSDFLATYPIYGAMINWANFHETGLKTVVSGVVVPAGQTPAQDLAQVLDTLANHPNAGPFIGKQLIQRLVTSNPTPEYVTRVSAVWSDDGTGQRGNLGAVVRAILMDREALYGYRLAPRSFGKLREPVLRATAFWRAFESVGDVNTLIYVADVLLGQRPVGAPSVFNFFRPDYTTNKLGARGLVAPELQISTTSTITRVANAMTYVAFNGSSELTDPAYVDPVLQLAPLQPVAALPAGLIELLDERLCGGLMSQSTRTSLEDYIGGIPYLVPGFPIGHHRIQEALALVAISPDCVLQQ